MYFVCTYVPYNMYTFYKIRTIDKPWKPIIPHVILHCNVALVRHPELPSLLEWSSGAGESFGGAADSAYRDIIFFFFSPFARSCELYVCMLPRLMCFNNSPDKSLEASKECHIIKNKKKSRQWKSLELGVPPGFPKSRAIRYLNTSTPYRTVSSFFSSFFFPSIFFSPFFF